MRSLFEFIHVLLAKAGMNNSAIARSHPRGTSPHRPEVRGALEAAPERKTRVRKMSGLAPYEGYVAAMVMPHSQGQITPRAG
jgi:hypothetical protein